MNSTKFLNYLCEDDTLQQSTIKHLEYVGAETPDEAYFIGCGDTIRALENTYKKKCNDKFVEGYTKGALCGLACFVVSFALVELTDKKWHWVDKLADKIDRKKEF